VLVDSSLHAWPATARLVDSGALWWLGGASLLVFAGSLLVVPWLVVRIPADTFVHERPPPAPWVERHPALRLLLHASRNLLGAVLVLAGLVLLAMPGQGLVTVFAGLSLMTFPGKYRLERWTVSRPAVLAAINWLRRRCGREPLRLG